MKALTVQQPWATLIVAGAKPYEFRSWRPPTSVIGQRIVIHAAKRKIDQAESAELFSLLRDGPGKRGLNPAVVESCLDAQKGLPILERAWPASGEPLHLGAGVGTAVLGTPRTAEEVARELGVPRVNDSTRHQHAIWAWPMLDVELWRAPLAMNGAQGFWTWPEPEEAFGLHSVSRPAKCRLLPSAARNLQSSPGRVPSAPTAAHR